MTGGRHRGQCAAGKRPAGGVRANHLPLPQSQNRRPDFGGALYASPWHGISSALLCYVYSEQAEFNGLEIAFKGGQIGSRDYLYQAQCALTTEFEEMALGSL